MALMYVAMRAGRVSFWGGGGREGTTNCPITSRIASNNCGGSRTLSIVGSIDFNCTINENQIRIHRIYGAIIVQIV